MKYIVTDAAILELVIRIQNDMKALGGDVERKQETSARMHEAIARVRLHPVPNDAIGFVHPSRTPDGKYTISFFPAEVSQTEFVR